MTEFFPELAEKRIVLASASPRRHHLLRELGLSFQVITTDADESMDPTRSPSDNAMEVARKKADTFQEIAGELLIITADTVVSLDGEVLGKPRNEAEAKAMLQRLSGRDHEVCSGVCVRSAEQTETLSDRTVVRFKTLTEGEIDHYVTNYAPLDKAGAYGIQEWIGYIGVESIAGSYFNVMGLPVHKLYRALAGFVN